MSDTSNIIFTGHDREYYGFRKRLACYLNEYNRSFGNNTGRSYRGSGWEIKIIHKFSFDSIPGDEYYHIECTVNNNGKNIIEKYSVSPEILVEFYRREKLDKLIRGLKTKV